ncbi:cell division control protein 14, SIN component-domain-containing protein, partial [Lentinula novae-zelandiae]
LTTQLCLSLSIVQGVALNHPRSKRWLGKIKSLEILVDLLLASRHVPSSIDSPASSSTSSKRGVTPPSLTSAILDTMLCILVDSTPALRAFEECNGVQAIVKILKRAGSPREVRMKCLEFLYFYLLDETKPSIPTASMSTGGSTLIDSVQTVPNTPSQHAPIRPSPKPRSEYGSSTFSFPHSSYSGPSTLRSVSSGSTKSFTSTSSTTSAASTTSSATTAPGSAECSPKKPSGGLSSKTPSGPPRTPAYKSSHHGVLRSEGKQLFPSGGSEGQARSLMMLAKDVDFVPQSPQKMQTFRRDNDPASVAPSPSVGVSVGTVTGMGGRRTRTHSRTRSAFALGATSTRISSRASSRERGHSRARSVGRAEPEFKEGLRMDIRARTTEEKKELLGTMLGNVDALVEGVRKAGIWGLG